MAKAQGILGEIVEAEGSRPRITVQAGDPVQVVREVIGTRQEIAALVLGAAPSGSPGLLVAAFAGTDAGKLPCPVMIIPGGLSDARLEQLS